MMRAKGGAPMSEQADRDSQQQKLSAVGDQPMTKESLEAAGYTVEEIGQALRSRLADGVRLRRQGVRKEDDDYKEAKSAFRALMHAFCLLTDT
jgi:hypothetical protein